MSPNSGSRDGIPKQPRGIWRRGFSVLIANKLVATALLGLVCVVGLVVAPFRWELGSLPRDRVAVDAIPDLGENQQIVFTEWPGRSPHDIEDQVTYPLTTRLISLPGVKTVRSSSFMGASSILVIFEEGVEFYWSRTRILEMLSSLPSDALPSGVAPTLGPDATALGQVFWYTLEGHAPDGSLVGGWDLHELRSVQDYTIRYALQSVAGVAEVSSIGGHVAEIIVEVDPEAMQASEVSIAEVARAIQSANRDVGARSIEINRVEYVVRSIGSLSSISDLKESVVAHRDDVSIRVKDVAKVGLGPAGRRGALDDSGAEVVGGVVVARYGANPMEVIDGVKAKLESLAPALPTRTLDDGRKSQVTIVPFYDRSGLIDETLGTLSTALWQQILITALIVIVTMRRMRSALIVTAVLPLGVFVSFVGMKLFSVDANVMALAGIAIAIGTMVDIGIVMTENIEHELFAGRTAADSPTRAALVARAAADVAPAIVTSVLTTVVSFLPVFALSGESGKLFTPLAFTKSIAMAAALVVALIFIPACAHLVFAHKPGRKSWSRHLLGRVGDSTHQRLFTVVRIVVVAGVGIALSVSWRPLGLGQSIVANIAVVAVLIAISVGGMWGFRVLYPSVLAASLKHKGRFLLLPAGLLLLGILAWKGSSRVFFFLPQSCESSAPGTALAKALPGLDDEFMPAFDEGSFLYMPSTMPHASLGQALESLQLLDAAIAAIPEVDRAVGKLGRVDSALDPAPISMFEVLVTYKSEYGLDNAGKKVRQWRKHIQSPDDIWKEITRAGQLPGLTSAPKLMPISTRLVMLQSGMRSSVGIKVKGQRLGDIKEFALGIEAAIRQVEGVDADTVFADRIVGKPYLEIVLDRDALAQHGLSVDGVQSTVSAALGGLELTTLIDGRERTSVSLRYPRELRMSVEAIRRVVLSSQTGRELLLDSVADVDFVKGPQVIRSEDSFFVAYVVFDSDDDVSDVAMVERVSRHLERLEHEGRLSRPTGVEYEFAGSYQSRAEANRTLTFLIPVVLILVFALIHLQFRRVLVTLSIFSGVAVAMAGGFILLWLYSKSWFLDVPIVGESVRALFAVAEVNMSIGVWVGLIALAGIATDAGVVMAATLESAFRQCRLATVSEVRALALEGGLRRLRPCLMSVTTTILALLPVISASGRGAELMLPMALPILGGMFSVTLTLIFVPLCYAWLWEREIEGARTRLR